MRALGLTRPMAPPDEQSAIPDLLVHALVPYPGSRPDYGMVLAVAAELDALAMFIEGPLSITLEMMSRRLRVAIDVARRANGAASAGAADRLRSASAGEPPEAA